MENTQGFYSKENGQILFAPNGVMGQTFNLIVEDKDSYIYPVGGWYWFDSTEEAEAYLNLNIENDTPLSFITFKIQEHLDNTVKTRNYDGILSLCSYALSTDPVFSAEGRAGLEWRDAVWRQCYVILNDVNTGVRPIPTVDEIIAELPMINW